MVQILSRRLIPGKGAEALDERALEAVVGIEQHVGRGGRHYVVQV